MWLLLQIFGRHTLEQQTLVWKKFKILLFCQNLAIFLNQWWWSWENTWYQDYLTHSLCVWRFWKNWAVLNGSFSQWKVHKMVKISESFQFMPNKFLFSSPHGVRILCNEMRFIFKAQPSKSTPCEVKTAFKLFIGPPFHGGVVLWIRVCPFVSPSVRDFSRNWFIRFFLYWTWS